MKYNPLDNVVRFLELQIRDNKHYIDLFNSYLENPNHVWDKSKGIIGYNKMTKNGAKQAIKEYLVSNHEFEQAVKVLQKEQYERNGNSNNSIS